MADKLQYRNRFRKANTVTQTYDCRTLTDKVAALQNKGFAPDWRIAELVHEFGMIDPFVSVQVKAEGIISYGLSSFGYDMRVADEFQIFTPSTGRLTVVDPKRHDPQSMTPFQGEVCVIPPNSFANEGIAQVLFAEGVAPNVSYADRKGKYQAQTGITFAKVQS